MDYESSYIGSWFGIIWNKLPIINYFLNKFSNYTQKDSLDLYTVDFIFIRIDLVDV